MSAYSEVVRKARKPHRCGGYRCTSRLIRPGDRYTVCTEYPGGDAGYADAAGHPVRMKVCADCKPIPVGAVSDELD